MLAIDHLQTHGWTAKPGLSGYQSSMPYQIYHSESDRCFLTIIARHTVRVVVSKVIWKNAHNSKQVSGKCNRLDTTGCPFDYSKYQGRKADNYRLKNIKKEVFINRNNENTSGRLVNLGKHLCL